MNQQQPPFEPQKQALLAELKALGIAYVCVEYSGSGDDGSVNGLYLKLTGSEEPLNFNAAKERFIQSQHHPTTQKVKNRLLGVEPESLEKRVEQLAYDALDVVGAPDWCNNDGGGGMLHIYVEAMLERSNSGEMLDDDGNVPAGTIFIEHYYNIIEQVKSTYTV